MDTVKTTSAPTETSFDYVLAGGGLQNGLIAWLILVRQPDARIALVESGERIGGNHTWSFHETDVPDRLWELLSSLVEHSWDSYLVHFPQFTREVALGYRSFGSAHFHAQLSRLFEQSQSSRLFLSTEVTEVHADRIITNQGTIISGRTIIDARGPDQVFIPQAGQGYQKFVGLELRLAAPAPITLPMLMDASVPQEDGFRFFYVLPLSPDTVLIEDTRFSDNARLDLATLQHAVLEYARDRGYTIQEVRRVESGVLPMPYLTRTDWPRTMPIRAGYAGGLMHPATGYSFPVALRFAAHIADAFPESPLGPAWDRLIQHHQSQYRFASFLNRMLFTAYAPEHRYHIFKQFYHHPEAMIARFYRLELKAADKGGIFANRPPRGFSFKRILKGALRR